MVFQCYVITRSVLVNTVREQFAKVREHYSPNPLFALSGEPCSWIVFQSSWTLFTKPPLCSFWWTLFVNSLPKFVNTVHQTPFLLFLVNIVREQFAKVPKHCSPNPLLAISGEHCSWTVCQSSWTLFTKPPFGAILVIMFVNILPVREHDHQ